MSRVSYQAIFLYEEYIKKLIAAQGEKLPKIPRNMHCTFKFNPGDTEIETFSKKVLGKKVKMKVIGYASDGKNSGFQVELDPETETAYTNAHTIENGGIPRVEKTIPHITVSMSEDAKPVDTGKLHFMPLEEPFEITGVGGLFVVGKKAEKQGVIFEPIETDRANSNPDNKTR